MFSSQAGPAVSRRAVLAMPVAFAGLAGLLWRRERPIPDPGAPGTGPRRRIVLFRDNGSRGDTVEIEKVVKSDAEWRRELSPEEYAVARRKGTEHAFTGRYWNHHEEGVYRCACCGTALFRSDEKYDSGSGWPSFWSPAAPENVATAEDNSLSMRRVEALCSRCDAHLGHVFPDGPEPSGMRYCINSAALRFAPGKSGK